MKPDRTTLPKRNTLRALSVLAVLIAAACGGDADGDLDSEEPDGTTGPALTGDVAATTDSTPSTSDTNGTATTDPATTDASRDTVPHDEEPPATGLPVEPSETDCVPMVAPVGGAGPEIVAPSEEPSAFVSLRSARRVDGTHLVSDLEDRLGTIAPLVLPPGRHETTVLGTPLAMDLSAPWRLMRADPGLLVFMSGDETLAQDRPLIRAGRPASVFLPEVAGDPGSVEAGEPDTEDVPESLLDWFDSIDSVVVRACASTEVSGAEAVVYDVEVDPDLGPTSFCQPIGDCVSGLRWHTSGPAARTEVNFNTRYRYQVWEIEQPETDIVVVSQASPDEADVWFERTAAFVTSWDLGDPAPIDLPEGAFAGIGDVTGGPLVPLSLPFLRFDVVEPVWAGTLGNFVAFGPIEESPPWQDGPAIELFVPNASTVGPVASAADVVSALDDAGIVTASRDDRTVLGVTASVIEIEGDGTTPVLRTSGAEPRDPSEDEGFGWWIAGPGETLWVVDLDGVGPLVIATAHPPDDREAFETWALDLIDAATVTAGPTD